MEKKTNITNTTGHRTNTRMLYQEYKAYPCKEEFSSTVAATSNLRVCWELHS